MKRVTTGANMASAMLRWPNRNGPPDWARHSRQMVQPRSISAWARDQILKPGKCPFRLTGSDARKVVNPEWISPQIERQWARWIRSAGNKPDIRHDFVKIIRDRQRIPDGGALVPQARHQDRRGQQQDFRPRRRIIGRGDDFIELQPGKLGQQPAT